MQSRPARNGRHGPVLLDDSHTRFRLWAPDARSVSLVIVGGDTLPMRQDEDGWYSLETEAGAGTRYSFLIDDELTVPDPASRAQSADVSSIYLQYSSHAAGFWPKVPPPEKR